MAGTSRRLCPSGPSAMGTRMRTDASGMGMGMMLVAAKAVSLLTPHAETKAFRHRSSCPP